MARPKSTLLTQRESELMDTLWELGTATAEQLRRKLPGDQNDSTVRTLLRVLVAKGHAVVASDSRPATYRPAVKRQTVQKKAMRDLLQRFFAGSAEDLVLHLLEDEQLSSEQLRKIQAAHRRRGKQGE